RLVDTLPVCIGRDDLGVYAMTLTCPHAGCNMATQGSVSFDGVFCACHGSRFTRDGDVSQGPAHDSLVHFAVSIDVDGNLTIHGGQEVSRGTRMAVPA
ncbi:MAG TPA: Rieske (2Fe-2S) protein, partial [Polyangiaceae bacterium]|nr:Rieske (2Fe-2S) protein [Polyangiaceae bacterium]